MYLGIEAALAGAARILFESYSLADLVEELLRLFSIFGQLMVLNIILR